jgi:hypothetical protein
VSIDDHLQGEREAIITVRGKKRFVVMDIEHYQYLRECELEAALLEARNDLESGNFIVETVEQHLQRLKDDTTI